GGVCTWPVNGQMFPRVQVTTVADLLEVGGERCLIGRSARSLTTRQANLASENIRRSASPLPLRSAPSPLPTGVAGGVVQAATGLPRWTYRGCPSPWPCLRR